ncbi:hypothetical protein HDU96_000717, partial [Phlyctochytrium bullatum]
MHPWMAYLRDELRDLNAAEVEDLRKCVAFRLGHQPVYIKPSEDEPATIAIHEEKKERVKSLYKGWLIHKKFLQKATPAENRALRDEDADS